MAMTPELAAKIAKKRGDAFAILQLTMEKDPNLLAKWETGMPSLSGANDDDVA